MADLGVMALLLGVALSAYCAIGVVIGEKMGRAALVVSARRALYMMAVAAAVASSCVSGSVSEPREERFFFIRSQLQRQGRIQHVLSVRRAVCGVSFQGENVQKKRRKPI